MGFLKGLITQLIPAEQLQDNKQKEELLLKEAIKYSKRFMNDYHRWKERGYQQEIIGLLSHYAQLKSKDPNANVNYYTYRSRKANGFYFNGEPLWSWEDHIFFVYYLIEGLEEEGYRVENSQRKVVEQERKLITTEQFYLKPKLRYRVVQPAEQLYGNIILEHQIINDKTSYVKIITQINQSRTYYPAKSFDGLLQKLFVA